MPRPDHGHKPSLHQFQHPSFQTRSLSLQLFQLQIMALSHSKLTLHTFYRSSCAARIRTAAAYKNIPLTYVYHDIPSNAHLSSAYANINPSNGIPTLTFPSSSNPENLIKIRQSVAIMEYFEEAFPDHPKLLPGDVLKRAQIRDMVNIITSDVQPLTSQSSLRRSERFGFAAQDWAVEIMTKGLKAYNSLIIEYGQGGKYSAGDEITMADICLAPAVEGAFRFDLEIEKGMPEVWRVYQNIKDLDAFKFSDWKHQEDTPPEFREN